MIHATNVGVDKDVPFVSHVSVETDNMIVVAGPNVLPHDPIKRTGTLGELLNRIDVLLFEWDNNFKTTREQRRTIWDKSL